MNKTKIEWCDSTLNPVVGCTFGCPFCYANKLNNRFGYVKDFKKPQFFPERLEKLNSKKPQIIFMDSMSDIADWEPEWLDKTEAYLIINNQHRYLFLTKRPELMSETGRFILQANVWNGVTITKEADVSRFNYLPAFGNRFASVEPIRGNLLLKEKHNLFFKFVHWVIIGAETGNQKDKVIPKKEWIDNIVVGCKEAGVPVFMKGSLKELMGTDFMQEWPKELKQE